MGTYQEGQQFLITGGGYNEGKVGTIVSRAPEPPSWKIENDEYVYLQIIGEEGKKRPLSYHVQCIEPVKE